MITLIGHRRIATQRWLEQAMLHPQRYAMLHPRSESDRLLGSLVVDSSLHPQHPKLAATI